MPQRRIDPDKIESVKASYDDMSAVLADSVDFIGEETTLVRNLRRRRQK